MKYVSNPININIEGKVDKNIVITHLQFPNKNIITSKDAFNAYKEFFDA